MSRQPSVIKSDRVRMSGRRAVGEAPSSPPAGAANPRTEAQSPTARIVEQGPAAVVIALTCPCGRTTYLECAYEGASAPSDAGE
ncbi:MAG: hypothetical protein KGY99_05005 [Phycisphaerae bacterium]|nr:hypothetical protein [Phycisphaerae bacterium]